MNNRMNVRAAILSTSAVFLAAGALGFSGGAPAGVTGSPGDGATCSLCHGNNAGTGSVQILDVPANYEANQVYTLRVRVADPAQAGAGFQITAENAAGSKLGTFMSTDSNTQNADGQPAWMTHTFTGKQNSITGWAAMGNAAEFTVDWTAPATADETVTFYAAGNAINNAGGSNGDIVYLISEESQAAVACPADFDGDGSVGSADLAQMLGAWGTMDAQFDLDSSGSVGAADLAQLLGAWGSCP